MTEISALKQVDQKGYIFRRGPAWYNV
jgi:hypothetical protein